MCKACLQLTFICLIIGVVFWSCSDDSSTNNSKDEPIMADENIGPEGGTIEIAGMIKLDIPAGAVTDTTSFAISRADAVTQPTAPMKPLSAMFTIEPSGLIFNSLATVTIDYDESKLGGKPEADIVIRTYENSSWVDIAGSVNVIDNSVSAEISHLSDFCVMIDTSSAAEGIFAKLVVARNVSYLGGYTTFIDGITASFDSAYAPCDPVNPIPGISVTCEQYLLTWAAAIGGYTYPEFGTILNPFIQLGENYIFTVTASGSAPALVDSIAFPAKNPYVIIPTIMSTHSRSSDLLVNWLDYGGGTIELLLVSTEGDSCFMVETTNDGSHLIASSNLTDLTPGVYSLILNYYNRKNISASGYDSRGFIAGRVINTTIITLE